MVGVAAVLAATVACGPSAAERQAEEARKQAEAAAEAASKAAEQAGGDLAKGVEGMAKGAEGFAKAMEGMAGVLAGAAKSANGGKAVDPVSFRDLQTALPTVSGWTMEKPKGERMTSPVAFSQTEVNYVNGDQRVEVKIVDSGFHQILLAPWTMFLAAGYEKETEEGYEKSIKLGQHPGFEKWNSEDKRGELNLVVGQRFLVSVEGRKLADAQVLHEFASSVDAAKLLALK
jgi:flagellar biosynthesis/type III secretory pathway protein FliH